MSFCEDSEGRQVAGSLKFIALGMIEKTEARNDNKTPGLQKFG